jgi:hypothetical protein
MIRIDDEEHKKIKRLAVDRDTTIKQLILDTLDKAFELYSGAGKEDKNDRKSGSTN